MPQKSLLLFDIFRLVFLMSRWYLCLTRRCAMKDYAFGNLITALRIDRGFSQFQLGKLLGVSDKAVSKWENGNAKPRISTCYRLADILGVSLGELLSQSGEMSSADEVCLETNDRTADGKMEERTLSKRLDRYPEKRAELHMRTNMSMSDGIVRVQDLLSRTEEWGMPAVALTDFCNTRGFPDTVSRFRKDKQKVIYGCEAILIPSAASSAETGVHIMLLARNRQGLVHLNQLVSLSYMKYFKRVPCMPRECVEKLRDGLLIGCSCEGGEVAQLLQANASEEELEECVRFYDYLEVQPIENELFGKEKQEKGQRERMEAQIRNVIRLGKQCGKPVAAVSCGRYLDPEDALSRAVLQYHDGIEHAEIQPPYYLRTTEEMMDVFSFLGKETAENIVIRATREIADRIDDSIDLYPNTGDPHRPAIPVIPDAEEKIRALVMRRAHDIYGDRLPSLIADRLEKEMRLISLQDSWSILEIARRAISWSVEKGYPVGIRGTVGASLVAWLVGVSTVNPLPPHVVCPQCHLTKFFYPEKGACGADLPEKNCPHCGKAMKRDGFDIPIESFLGMDGKRLMDIDLNFSDEIQQKVHAYIRSWFGQEHVFRPGTVATLSPDRVKKMVQCYLTDHAEQRSAGETEHAEEQMSWVIRNIGQHPGGLVIVPEELDISEFTPIQYLTGGKESLFPITQYDFNVMHDRLFKMDFLGHKTPTMLGMMQKASGVPVDEIPLHDDGVMSLFYSPEALGVREKDIFAPNGLTGIPEFGTEFIMEIVKAVRPTTVEELMWIQGWAHGHGVWPDNVEKLLREQKAAAFDLPGTRDDITSYLTRHGVSFDIAFAFSELVRKGMGFKAETMPEMIEPIREAGIPDWYIRACKKMIYLFPRSHAAAYTADALRLGWYKLYHPEAFYPAWVYAKRDHLEEADLTMDVIQLRKAILSIRTELQYGENDSSDQRTEKKERLIILRLLLEMKLRGCSLSDDFLEEYDINR